MKSASQPEFSGLLAEEEAAHKMRCTPRKLRRMRQRGEIRFTRVGKTPMYRPQYLDEYADHNEVRPSFDHRRTPRRDVS